MTAGARSPSPRVAAAAAGSDAGGDHVLESFLVELGRALSLAGAAVGEVQERLAGVAAANGAEHARIVVLPTAIIVAPAPGRWATVESVGQLGTQLRLDQIAAVYRVTDDARRGRVGPVEGLARLRAVRDMRPQHGVVVTVATYAAMTAGFCLVLRPGPRDLAVALVLGVLTGLIVVATRAHAAVATLVPVLCATLVSALSFEAVRHDLADPGLRTLIAPLITFLPGAAVTTATLELASGEMVAGASRLVSGAVQLLLLAFGIVAGAELAGLPSEVAVQDAQTATLGAWAPWLGVVVFALAAAWHFSAPGGALGWLLLVVMVAWVGQQAGDRIVGADVSGFFGALAMTPVALAVGRLPDAPPAQVTFLPAFWLLVPGALGLIGVTQLVGDPADANVGDLVAPVGAIVSIALGVLCGASVFRGLVRSE